MATSPSLALSDYQRAARTLAVKSALPLAAVLLSPSAQAQAVAFHPTSGNVISPGLTTNRLFIDFDTFKISHSLISSSDSQLSVAAGGSYADGVTADVSADNIAAVFVDGITIAQRLNASYPVNSALTFGPSQYAYLNSYSYDVPAFWANAVGSFIGLKFTANDAQVHYGWLQVNTNADASEVTLLGFGYNQTPGASILAGEGTEYVPVAVPEPISSAALLALGAAGLVAYRRRKHLQRAAA